MTVLELLDEMEDILNTGASIPLAGKIMVDKREMDEVINEIRQNLPEELNKAKWIVDQQANILEKAKREYAEIINQAQREAEHLVETDDITAKAKKKSKQIMDETAELSKNMRLSTLEYIDNLIYEFQNRLDALNATYLQKMMEKVAVKMDETSETLEQNRREIQDLMIQTKDENTI